MLIAKGYRVVFRSARTGKNIYPPASSALLHDPEGKSWNKNSGLVAGFRRERLDVTNGEAEKYFNYEPNGGKINLPPKSLGQWHLVDEVDYIVYTRPGDREGLGNNLRYEHDFKNYLPKVYRRGRVYRIELGPTCKWNWRGISSP
jgi:hypothetical protein